MRREITGSTCGQQLVAVPRVGESGSRAPTSLESSVGQQWMNDTKQAARLAACAAGAAVTSAGDL